MKHFSSVYPHAVSFATNPNASGKLDTRRCKKPQAGLLVVSGGVEIHGQPENYCNDEQSRDPRLDFAPKYGSSVFLHLFGDPLRVRPLRGGKVLLKHTGRVLEFC